MSIITMNAQPNFKAGNVVTPNNSSNSSGGESSGKPKKNKSRNGCLTCKKKRLKCDETKPFCVNCTKKNIQCGGYATAFKWKSFDQSTNPKDPVVSTSKNIIPISHEVKPAAPAKRGNPMVRSKSGIDESILNKHLEAASLSMTGKNLKQIKMANDLILQGRNPDFPSPEDYSNNESLRNSMMQRSQSLDGSGDLSLLRKPRTLSGLSNMSPVDLGSIRKHYSMDSEVLIDEEDEDSTNVKLEEDKKSLRDVSNNAENKKRRQGSEVLPSELLGSIVSPAPPMISPAPNSQASPNYASLNSLASLASHIKNSPGFSGFNLPSPSDFYNTSNSPPNSGFNNMSTTGATPNYQFSPSLNAFVSSSSQFQEFLNGMQSPKLNDEKFSAATPPSNFLGNTATTKYNTAALSNQNGPSLSTLISAFTDFDNDGLSAPSPFDLKDQGSHPSPHSVSSMTPKNATMGVFEHKQQQQQSNPRIPKIEEEDTDVQSGSSSSDSDNQQSQQLIVTGSSNPSFTINLPTDVPLSEQERILKSFDTYTCGIMSMKNGPTENPWRSLILPMSQKFPVIYNAIASMTCFHVARGDSVLRSVGLKHMKMAIVELAKGLSTNSLPPDVALIACLALAVSECWDRHISTGIAHLRGARSMILKVLQNFKYGGSANSHLIGGLSSDETETDLASTPGLAVSSSSNQSSPNSIYAGKSKPPISNMPKDLQFLFNVWVYFDVLARMTSDSNHEERFFSVDSPPPTSGRSTPMESEVDALDGENCTKRRRLNRTGSTGSVNEGSSKSRRPSVSLIDQFEFNDHNEEVDPLLGCAQSLFPIIGKIASLISKIRKNDTKKSSLSIISSAAQLKKELTEWKPTPSMKMIQVEDPLWDLSSCIATAEAYRYATLLYLHQAVPELPSLSSHQIAEKILMLLASIPTSSRTCVVHIFPLLVASCEAHVGDERDWCRERWQLLAHKMWIGNIDRAVEVVKEVWSRKDAMKGRRKSTDSISRKDDDETKLENIALQISGIMAAVNGNGTFKDDLEEGRISSWTHWTTVMKEWGWEVLLA